MARKTGRATITSVAEYAGVSRQTVSNVLHTPGMVAPETRQRVEEAIAALDYRPHLAARSMRTDRSQAIAVRIASAPEGVSGLALERFTHALCAAARTENYHLIVFVADSDDEEIATYKDLLATLNLDGVVVVATHRYDQRIGWLTEHGVPFVAFGRSWSPAPEHSWVDVDGSAGTYAATRHLLDAGHRKIAFFGWDDSAGVGDDRESGWRRALTESDPAAEFISLNRADTIENGAAMADQLADEHPDVTAAVCVSDSIAVGAARGNLEAGRSLALVGFDDTAAALALGISSVVQPLEEAASHCFRLLHQQLTDREGARHQQILLEPNLNVRR
ncbi:MAG: LacI family DNA-binding transcriptional regulator [Streptomyces sp.]|nr:LacI family DNA-binding transcriptional regulator [Streptomyces sp.]NUS90607.1 LacI family DNA-binding transcriptional regulator [Streptomyces sp.]